MSKDKLTTVFNQVHGFLSLSEAELLYKLASECPKGGNIVEIGSYQGRSTVCLGLGAKVSGAKVWAIDPHDDIQLNETTHYGMENHAALLRNLVNFEVANVVRVVALSSMDASCAWNKDIHLLFIDGKHDYLNISDDLCWINFMKSGSVLLHDTSGHFPDVTHAMTDLLERNSGKWTIDQQVDSITALKRV